jgi:predicted permease
MRRLLARLIAVFRRSTADDDFAQELDAHVEMLTEDNIARGMSPAEARRAARIKVGAASSLRMRHRDERGLPIVEDLAQDVTFAIRLMARDKWFSAAAVIAIGLGIGANTVGFSIINAAFLRGFAFEDAERLHALSWRPDRGFRMRLSYPDYEEWRTQSQSFDDLAAYTSSAINISDDHAAPVQTQGAWVTANHFDVLRQAPLLGRTFADGEDRRGAAPVLIIGFDIWATRFNRSEDVLGRTLRVNGVPTTIIGVMPQGMKFPDDSELWVPFVPSDAQLTRDVRPLTVFGRLRDGVSRSAADAEIDGIARQTMAAHPEQTKDVVGGQVETFIQRYLGRQVRPMFIAVMGAVMFVLLIACANVANLLLVRGETRALELDVRAALGAGTWRIARSLLVEHALLAVFGGLVGLLVAYGALQGLLALAPQRLPRLDAISLDARSLAFGLLATAAAAAIFSTAPLLRAARTRLATRLRGSRGASSSAARHRTQNALVVGQVALALVLLVSSGLMIRTFEALRAVEPGFTEPKSLQTFRIAVPVQLVRGEEDVWRTQQSVADALRGIPGVESVGFTNALPMEQVVTNWDGIQVEGGDNSLNGMALRVFNAISPGYLRTMGMSVVAGRDLTFEDVDGMRPVALISDGLARELWSSPEAAVGQRIRGPVAGSTPWREIIGVVADVRMNGLDAAPPATVYWPPIMSEFYPGQPFFVYRAVAYTVRSPLAGSAGLTRQIEQAVWSVNRSLPVASMRTMGDIYDRSLGRTSFTLVMLVAAAGAALVLGIVGLYGVLSYAVSTRRREIAIRFALGARARDVERRIVRQGVVLAGIGVVIGLAAAAAVTRAMSSLLYEVQAVDPLTYAAVAAGLIAVAALASYLPARRASTVDPAESLAAE